MSSFEPSLSTLSHEGLIALLDGDARQQCQLARLLIARLDRSVFLALRDFPRGTTYRDDIVAELLAYLYRRNAKILRDWNPERAGLRGYLDMIAGRFARRWLASQPDTAALLEEQLGPRLLLGAELEVELEYRDGLAQIETFLDAHGSPKDRVRFRALFVLGRSPAEEARDTGTTVEALHTWASRLKKRVRRALPELRELFDVTLEDRVKRVRRRKDLDDE
ncbi:hypothetical protein [Paraliomyxa miuraensis]|uniref:hypothetical protein n=1 Tax=Paraliomyxa miuraensis TaxID=376150 RepID=UPI00224F8E8F|nr:hypothetical protein [Paraliomyxa miuraensis]MCX4240591.1 hypothetical protein [Paraliomyxa miuraensis]